MKKKFTFMLLSMLLSCVVANAQDKKTWDFTKGLSAETVANLNADGTNWAANGTDANGVTNNWKNHAKHTASEPWKANGEEIAELKGLLINIGSNGDNSLHLAQDKMRLTRNNTIITFPKLKSGQTVTIVGRSANGDAGGSGAHRYIKPVQDYLTLIDGVQTNGMCSFLGNKVEGSLGTYTFIWQVETSETEAVDVQFTLPSAGIDFTLFMIDSGDEAQIAKLAYLYGGEDEQILTTLKNNELYDVTAINMASQAVTADELKAYDVTIVSPAMPCTEANAQLLAEAMPWTPILNLNSGLYEQWGYGTAVPTYNPVGIVTKSNNIFKDVELESVEGDTFPTLTLTSEDVETVNAINLGDYFKGDAVLAAGIDEDEDANMIIAKNDVVIHTHNITHNGYIYVAADANYSTASVLQIIDNAFEGLGHRADTSRSRLSRAAGTEAASGRAVCILHFPVEIKDAQSVAMVNSRGKNR